MHHVELAGAGRQLPTDPPAERAGFGKARRAHQGELGDIDTGPELARHRNPERVRLAVEIKARDRDIADPVIEHRPRLTGEHGHLVAETDQLTGQVPGVDALATRMWIAPIDQKGDPQGVGLRS